MERLYQEKQMSKSELTNIMDDLMMKGDVEITLNHANPHASPFDSEAKKAWEAKAASNPLAGKGKSYADRVEGPDGWGKHVPVTKSDHDLLDELFSPF